jgi:DNA-binding transcriptional MerR regulator
MSAGGAEQVLAFPDTKAARLAHVSIERLRRWEEADLVVPSIKETLSPRNTVRLYSFQDMPALLVVAELRIERDMSLQHIRKVVSRPADHRRRQGRLFLVRQRDDSVRADPGRFDLRCKGHSVFGKSLTRGEWSRPRRRARKIVSMGRMVRLA